MAADVMFFPPRVMVRNNLEYMVRFTDHKYSGTKLT